MKFVWLFTVIVFLSQCAHVSVRNQMTATRLFPVLSQVQVGSVTWSSGNAKGHAVVVGFIATWCFSCMGQVYLFENLQQEYAAKGLQVVLVGFDLEGSKVLQPYAQTLTVPLPMLLATDDLRNGLTEWGQVKSLPQTYIFDREGKLVAGYEGPAPADALKTMVEQALR